MTTTHEGVEREKGKEPRPEIPRLDLDAFFKGMIGRRNRDGQIWDGDTWVPPERYIPEW